MQAQKLVVFDDKDQWLHAVIHIGKTNEGLEVSLARGTGWTITEAAQKAPRERGFARARAIGALEQGRKDLRAQAVKHDQRRVVPSGRNLSSPPCFFQMMDAFTLLSFVVTFLVGATAGAWVNSLTNSYVLRSPSPSSTDQGDVAAR